MSNAIENAIIKEYMDHFHDVFCYYDEFGWMDKYFPYSDLYFEISNEITIYNNSVSNKLISACDETIDNLKKRLDKERINCFRKTIFTIPITFYGYQDYTICTGVVQPNKDSPLITLGTVKTFGEAFDLLGDKDSNYPDSVYLDFEIKPYNPDYKNAEVIVSHNR